MSTAVLTQPVAEPRHARASPRDRGLTFAWITCLTALSLIIHGYHPCSEDGGLYITGIKRLLDPSMYPHSVAFVEAHLRFSLFAPIVAALVRFTHLSLPVVLLAIHLASIWMTLFAVWLLAARCYTSGIACAGATALTAAWLTLPVAGTSLILMDPYVTARSISLPCNIFALVGTIDLMRATSRRGRLRGFILCLVMLLLAAVVHPLMAGYALGGVLLLATMLASRPTVRALGMASLGIAAVVLAVMLQTFAPPESPNYIPVAVSRYYWFLSRWHWFEVSGLIAPLFVLAFLAFRLKARLTDKPANLNTRALASMAIAAGSIALLIALGFAHESSAIHVVARLQPLRIFQLVYAVMILMLGAALGEHLLGRSVWRWMSAFASLATLMFFVQVNTYPSSAHIEWPATAPVNPWEQAFRWISQNTPRDALFALDANYITSPGEDAQSFRAIAERSALPDYSKDGGEASITPSLTMEWTVGQQAQTRLNAETDAHRIATLQPLNVDWIVLQQYAITSLHCPYNNQVVKVCRLPRRDTF